MGFDARAYDFKISQRLRCGDVSARDDANVGLASSAQLRRFSHENPSPNQLPVPRPKVLVTVSAFLPLCIIIQLTLTS